ncbi:MAG: PEP/pyruvate-binding domain-containing protein [bacterium]
MKAIILGAGPNFDVKNKYPPAVIKDKAGRRTLDWIIKAFKYSNIKDIVFVGGYKIDEIIKNFQTLRIYRNPNWANTGILHSLFCAEKELNDDLIISYSDIVFKPNIIKKLLGSKNLITLVIDTNWKNRYYDGSGHKLLKAEKVCVSNGLVAKIGKNIPLSDNICGEFIGLAYLKKEGAQTLKAVYRTIKQNRSKNLEKASLIEMLQELIDRGVPINFITTEGEWATLDSPKDLKQFIFGTKGETLERLQTLLKKGKICGQIRFEVKEWEKDREYWLKVIQKHFGKKKIIIRSSAIGEDSASRSMAGKYKSIKNIYASKKRSIVRNISKVIGSYGKENYYKNQILVQEQVDDIKMSGVILTRSLETGSPYYTINYDERSRETDTITGGTALESSTVLIYKNIDVKTIKNKIFKRLVEVCKELERITGSDRLDIEFALTNNDDIFIFQVRPMTSTQNTSKELEQRLAKEISSIKNYIRARQHQLPHIYGKTTLFGDMTDWNPAEIIGTKPKPLALSLYKHLILNNVWREAKEKIGYFNPHPEPLLISLVGKPYIDIRISFNAFLPKDLPKKIAEKLVNYYLRELRVNPEKHDKVEFDILFTSLTLGFDKNEQKLYDNGFSRDEIKTIREALFKLTENIITQKLTSISDELGSVAQLEEIRKRIQKDKTLSEAHKIKRLLDHCKRLGTTPFSILARYAFIGTSFLKELVADKMITRLEHDDYLRSINNITSNTINDFKKLQNKEMSQNSFLRKYGHLRPGTYDILSPRYDESPEIYLKMAKNQAKAINKTTKTAKLPLVKLKNIDKKLRDLGFSFDSGVLFKFIENGLMAREYSKFEFTRTVSDILRLIEKYGKKINMGKEALAFVPIEEIVGTSGNSNTPGLRARLLKTVGKNQAQYNLTQLIKLPQLITTSDDAEMINMFKSKPNYVTQKKITAEVVHLKSLEGSLKLDNRVVLIENADPGFDWIFSRRIKGLITKYGGAASHMTIRCAELGLPAAIGCGENLFEKIKKSNMIELNCENETIKTIS